MERRKIREIALSRRYPACRDGPTDCNGACGWSDGMSEAYKTCTWKIIKHACRYDDRDVEIIVATGYNVGGSTHCYEKRLRREVPCGKT